MKKNYNEFYKFRALQKCKNQYILPEKVEEIFIKICLYAPSFEKLNDIEEGLFYHKGISKSELEDIKNLKETKHICSFSSTQLKDYEKLMWAHYANGSKGIKIKFLLTNDTAKKVTYKKENDEEQIYNNPIEVKNDLNTILSTKNKCWEYEKEYRVISNKKYIPITITEVTFGKNIQYNDVKNIVEKIIN
ncbi:DUF2971 domain-containing protein, partial [Campylobacter volucris]